MKDKEISQQFVEHTVILYLLTFKYKDIANWWSLNTNFKSKNYLQRVHNSTKEVSGTSYSFKLNNYTCTYSIIMFHICGAPASLISITPAMGVLNNAIYSGY